MKKRLLALILCILTVMPSVPVIPLTDILSMEAVAVNIESLEKAYADVPDESEWGNYINGDSLKYVYLRAKDILANPSSFSQKDIDECATDLAGLVAALKPYATGLSIDKSSLSIAVGKAASLKATLSPDGAGGTVEWTSSHPSYVSVSSEGVVSANRYTAEKVTVKAKVSGKNGSEYTSTCSVTVVNPVAGVKLSPNTLTLYNGEETKLSTSLVGFDSTAAPSGSVLYTWDSDDTSVAQVDDNGRVTAKGVGTCKITVKVKNAGDSQEYTDTCSVTVNKLIPVQSLVPETNLSSGMISGESVDYYVSFMPANASVKKLRWLSSDPDIVDVTKISVTDSGKAVATLVAGKVGVASISYSATDGSGIKGSISVEVKPKITSLTLSHTSKSITLVSTNEKITASILPVNAGNQVLNWQSNNERVCKVDRLGVLYPVSSGECTITVSTTDGSNIVKTCKVIVCEKADTVKISAPSNSVEVGERLRLSATVTTTDGYAYSDVKWSSSDTTVAEVDQNGIVTAKYPGSVAIKATAVDGSGKYDSYVIKVTQKITGLTLLENVTLSVGDSVTLVPRITPEYATDKSLSWSTTNVSVASVDTNGLVTAKNVGVAKITCTSSDGSVSATCTVKVVIPATGITISSSNEELWKGNVVQLIAIVTPSSATDKTVTWSSSDNKVATVTSDGLVTAVAGGQCVITAKNSAGKTDSCRITVYENCTGVKLESTAKAMYVGQSDTIAASVIPSTATNKAVTWSSSVPSVATVSKTGVINALREGSTVITVKTQEGGFTASCTVTVYGKIPVKGISLDRRSVTVSIGVIDQLVATISPANASEKGVVWSCDNSKVLAIDQKGRFKGLKAGTAVLTATSVDGNFTSQCKITVTQPVTGVRITTTDVKLAIGKSKALTWTVFPEDATDKSVRWTSSNSSVAEVTQAGIVNAKKAGVTVISVTTVDGEYTSTCNFTVYVPVTGVSIVKNAQGVTDFSVAKGESFLLSADVKPSNATNKSVSWVSSNTSIATVNESGQVTGVGKGSANITCTTVDGAYRATCVVKVIQPVESIKLDVSSVSLEVGKSKTITAKVSPSTASYLTVKWTSSNPKIATVDSNGVVKGVSAGTVTVTAQSVDTAGVKATCKVTIIQPVTGIKLNRTSGYVRIGEVGVLKATVLPTNATNQKVTWTSSDVKKATVTADGVVKGISQGTVTITAKTVNGGYTASCKIVVVKSVTGIKLDKASVTINVGKTTTIKPTISPADATVKTVYWTSSNYDVASVDSEGKVTAKAAGYAVITAKTKDGSFTAKTELLVIQPVTSVKLNKTSAYLNLNSSMTLIPTISPSNASIKSVTWSSSDPSIATVSSSGVVTGIKKGVVTITCKTTNSAKTATCKIAVVKRVTGVSLNKEEAILYFGRTLTLSSTVYPVDATVQDVIYTSNNSNIASVSANGVVTPVNTGSTYIVATTKDGAYKAYCKVSVGKAPESIKLGVYSATMNVGKSGTLKYAVYPTDARNRVATFTSSNTAVATVTSTGLVTAKARGTANITVMTENGIKAVCKVTVNQQVNGIELSDLTKEVYTGESIKLSAKVLPSNANNQNVVWSTSDKRIAVVSASGVVTGVKAGNVEITATSVDGSYKAKCEVTVKQHVTSVEFVETEIAISKGNEMDLRFSVLPYDATNKEVTFESSDRSIVSVTNEGHITAHLGGTAEITVKTQDGGYTARCYVTVQEPATGISLNYNEKEMFVGDSLELIATVSPSDATNKLVRWSSSSASAQVNSNGVVTAVKSGKATITATTADGGYTAVCELTLLQKATSVVVDKTEVKINRGTTHQLTATVLPEDCYNRNYIWASENEQIASVDSTGLVSAIAPGVVRLVCTSVESGHTAIVTVTVHEPVTSLTLDETEVELYTPLTKKLTAEILPANASDKSVTWTSSNEQVATVSDDGTVTAVEKGEAVITVTSNDTGVSSSCKFVVLTGVEGIITEKDEYSVHENKSFKIDYSFNPQNVDDPSVSFESSDEDVFTVAQDGTVSGLALGEAELTITSKQNTSITKTVKINVTRAVTQVTLNEQSKTVYVGDSFELVETVSPADASDKSVSWISGDESVLSVDENGLVTALSRGETEITVRTTDGSFEAVCSVTVIQNPTQVLFDKENYSVNVGETLTVNATVLPENTNDKTLTWKSSDEAVATVDENGVVTPVKAGECEITAYSVKQGVEKTACVKVVQLATEIKFLCRVPDLFVEEKLRVFATVLPEDTTDKSFKWTSGDEKIAVIDKYGVITALSTGTVQIFATSCDEGAVKGVINLNIVERIDGISLDIENAKLHVGNTLTLKATVTPENAYNKSVKFESSNEDVLTVDENGKVTAVSVGTATVSAISADGKFTATAEITVIKNPQEIQLFKTEYVLKTGEKEKIQYELLPSDSTENTVTWKSSDESVAVVSKQGVVTAVGKGTANITLSVLDGEIFEYVVVKVEE